MKKIDVAADGTKELPEYHVYRGGFWANGCPHDSFTFVEDLDHAKALVVDLVATGLPLGGSWSAGVDCPVDDVNDEVELYIRVEDGRIVEFNVPEYDRERPARTSALKRFDHSRYAGHVRNGETGDLLERVILGLAPDDPREVEFINGNPLDCRRENLRVVEDEDVEALRSGADVIDLVNRKDSR
jgi:hypothetical protein